MTDTVGRPLRDLRISVTDRCNFRCVYCMPKEVFGRDYRFLDRRELLTFEEIERLAHAFVANGVEKIRDLPDGGARPLPRCVGVARGLGLRRGSSGLLAAQRVRAGHVPLSRD